MSEVLDLLTVLVLVLVLLQLLLLLANKTGALVVVSWMMIEFIEILHSC